MGFRSWALLAYLLCSAPARAETFQIQAELEGLIEDSLPFGFSKTEGWCLSNLNNSTFLNIFSSRVVEGDFNPETGNITFLYSTEAFSNDREDGYFNQYPGTYSASRLLERSDGSYELSFTVICSKYDDRHDIVVPGLEEIFEVVIPASAEISEGMVLKAESIAQRSKRFGPGLGSLLTPPRSGYWNENSIPSKM